MNFLVSIGARLSPACLSFSLGLAFSVWLFGPLTFSGFVTAAHRYSWRILIYIVRIMDHHMVRWPKPEKASRPKRGAEQARPWEKHEQASGVWYGRLECRNHFGVILQGVLFQKKSSEPILGVKNWILMKKKNVGSGLIISLYYPDIYHLLHQSAFQNMGRGNIKGMVQCHKDYI